MNIRMTYWFFGAAFAVMFAVGLLSLALPRAHAAPLPAITSTLDFGARGANVTTLQTLLASSQSLYPAGLVTGYYGPLTRTAVMQFQIANGLPPVGRVGPLTLARLNAIIATGASTIDVDAPFITDTGTSETSSEVTITWTTNEPSMGRVHYSTGPLVMQEISSARNAPVISGFVAVDSSATTNHSLRISGLSSNQLYYYVIEALDPSMNISVTRSATFTTD